jgi:HSP20 family protein
MNTLLRWPLVPLGRDFDWFFNNSSEALPAWWQPAAGFPPLNLWCDEEAVHLEAEVPGLRLEQLELTVSGDQLTLSGERPDGIGQDVIPHRRERAVGRFSRTITLPFPVEAAQVEARLLNGVLSVELPKAQAVRPFRVEVKAAQ